MIKQGIQNVIFDFGGVLVDLDRQRCIRTFKELGIKGIDRYLDVSHHLGFFMQFEKGEITAPVFRDEIRSLSGSSLTDTQIDNAWNSLLGLIPSYKLENLLSLRKRYKTYLLSNTNSIHWKWSCERLFRYKDNNMQDYFEKIYLSYELGCAKPAPSVFEAVITDSGIKPEETFFIDDSQANCETAQSIGFSVYQPANGEDWSFIFK